MSLIIDSLAKLAEKFSQKYPGEASGVATLDANARIPTDQVFSTGGSDTHKAMGLIEINTAAVGNVGAGEDDLMSYILPGGTLDIDGKSVRITVGGSTGAAGKSVTVYFLFGGTRFDLVLTETSGLWWGTVVITRTTSTTFRGISSSLADGAGTPIPRCDSTNGTETMSGDITLKVSGENHTDATNNAVIQQHMLIELLN